MSVDIRRSTELMLKARSAKEFANFIMCLCNDLKSVIIKKYGIFDKFTGDGILCFFPDFYSGDDAGYYAVKAAIQCHKIFDHYSQSNRSSFKTILKNTGLGIGIDHGQVHLVHVGGELTVVGEPVVYACRMGGVEAGNTLLNQPAYEKISEKFSSFFNIEETEIDIKHEGSTIAYQIKDNGRVRTTQKPSWENENWDDTVEND